MTTHRRIIKKMTMVEQEKRQKKKKIEIERKKKTRQKGRGKGQTKRRQRRSKKLERREGRRRQRSTRIQHMCVPAFVCNRDLVFSAALGFLQETIFFAKLQAEQATSEPKYHPKCGGQQKETQNLFAGVLILSHQGKLQSLFVRVLQGFFRNCLRHCLCQFLKKLCSFRCQTTQLVSQSCLKISDCMMSTTSGKSFVFCISSHEIATSFAKLVTYKEREGRPASCII